MHFYHKIKIFFQIGIINSPNHLKYYFSDIMCQVKVENEILFCAMVVENCRQYAEQAVSVTDFYNLVYNGNSFYLSAFY